MSIFRKNAKAIAALLVGATAAYFTPEMVDQFGRQAGEIVQAGVVAALTAIVVWATPNKR